jgi:hypothetical protein
MALADAPRRQALVVIGPTEIAGRDLRLLASFWLR